MTVEQIAILAKTGISMLRKNYKGATFCGLAIVRRVTEWVLQINGNDAGGFQVYCLKFSGLPPHASYEEALAYFMHVCAEEEAENQQEDKK